MLRALMGKKMMVLTVTSLLEAAIVIATTPGWALK